MSDTPTSWIVAVGAMLGGSGGKLIYDVYKVYRTGGPKELKPLAIVDANLSAVVKARDEVIEDNVRLRQERVEQDARHASERAVWLADQTRLRQDIAVLEARLRSERDEAATRSAHLEQQIREERIAANQRYEALLNQVQSLGIRTTELEGP